MKSTFLIWLPVHLFLGCGGGSPAHDGGPGGDISAGPALTALVESAIKAGCSPASLSAVSSAGGAAAAVRAAIVALDKKAKLSSWTAGLTHGHAIKASLKVTELAKLTFHYSIYVPKGYSGSPGNPIPLWVDPAHPTGKLKDDVWLPYLAKKTSEQFIYVTVNFMNRVFSEFDDSARKAISAKNTAFDQDYFSVLDAAIAQVKRAYYVDTARVYISGISAKGASSWFHGIASADTYAALHPVSIIPAPFHKDLWLNLLNLPALVWQGKADTVTPYDKVDPLIQQLKGYGLSIEYWIDPNGIHGGSLYYAKLSDAAVWLLKQRRKLTPQRVHKGIKSSRAASAYWLKVSGFSTPPDESVRLYPTAPSSTVAAQWSGNKVAINRVEGVSKLELRWLMGTSGLAGMGSAGDSLAVEIKGKPAGTFTLKEDNTVALEDYCERGDVSRLWAGRLKVAVP